MTRIILIRHAESVLNVKECVYGSKDQSVPLTLRGSRQAARLRVHLAKENISASYSSPARRARDTAALAGIRKSKLRISKVLSDRILGIEGHGEWEEIYSANPSIVRALKMHTDFRFPKGESMRDVERRIMPFMRMLLRQHQNQTVAVFTHADIIRNIVGSILKIPYGMRRHLAIPNASRTIIEHERGVVVKGMSITVVEGVGLPA